MAKFRSESSISLQVDQEVLIKQTRRGLAGTLKSLALKFDPECDKQDMRALTQVERERSLQVTQRVAESHLGQITTLSMELNLLGGRGAAKRNPQAAKLLQAIEQREKSLGEIKFDGRPVIDEDQVYRMETACQMAGEGFRQAATAVVVNTLGLDNAMNLLLQGTPPEKIVQPVEDLLQQALHALSRQSQR